MISKFWAPTLPSTISCVDSTNMRGISAGRVELRISHLTYMYAGKSRESVSDTPWHWALGVVTTTSDNESESSIKQNINMDRAYNTQLILIWSCSTQSRELQADWFILEINEKATLNIDIPYSIIYRTASLIWRAYLSERFGTTSQVNHWCVWTSRKVPMRNPYWTRLRGIWPANH